MVSLSLARKTSDLIAYPKVVVDAGPLMSILVLKFAFTLDPVAARAAIDDCRIAPYLHTDVRQRAMIRLFDHVREISTTSHVIGELQGLQRLKGNSQTGFWETAMNWLESKGLNENLVSLMALQSRPHTRKWVCEIGPPDSGLIDLAIQQDTALLTDDGRTMLGRAVQNGVDCRLVQNELRNYE